MYLFFWCKEEETFAVRWLVVFAVDVHTQNTNTKTKKTQTHSLYLPLSLSLFLSLSVCLRHLLIPLDFISFRLFHLIPSLSSSSLS
eukprot:m.107083 g.107083  ORF g.107083 m.107083 type:complete len:86 (+) comp15173_c5_seq3:456-713(+)